MDLLNKKKRNTTSNENNDGEIKPWAYENNYHSYNGGNETDNGKDTDWQE